MSEQQDNPLGLPESDGGGSLLDAFIEAGAIEGFEDEAPVAEAQEGAEAGEDAEITDEQDVDAETEVEAQTEEGDEEDGDYVEFDGDDGETNRVPVSEMLQAYQQLKELGPDVSHIRSQVMEQAQQQVSERIQSLDTTINEAAQAYALINELVPNLEEPSEEYLNSSSPHYNPDYYRQQKQLIAAVGEQVGAAKERLQGLVEARKKEDERAREQDINNHWMALTQSDPSWSKLDQKAAVKRLNDLREGIASTYGLSREEVGGIYHNSFIRMAQDALAYRKANSKPIEPKQKSAPRLVKAGSTRKSTRSADSKRRQTANANLAKHGKVTDLEGVWGEFLD